MTDASELYEIERWGKSYFSIGSNGQVKDFNVLVLDDIKGYRITFDWFPTNDSVEPVELRLFIRTNDRTLSETWLYQYFPPAPDKRKYT